MMMMIIRKIKIKNLIKRKDIYCSSSCNLFHVEQQYYCHLPSCFECLIETSHALVNT